jgi:type I restriction enzyme S subunit
MFDCRFETGFINAQMMIIRSSDSIVPRYLAEFISLPLTQQHLKASNSGTAVPQLTAAQMKELKIIVPELAAQRKFVQRFDAARHILLQNSAHLTQLDTLFASLQHRAFRGEL